MCRRSFTRRPGPGLGDGVQSTSPTRPNRASPMPRSWARRPSWSSVRRDPDADVRDRSTTTWSGDHPARLPTPPRPPLALNRVGSPSVLESLQSTPRFLAQGIGTESSREESNRSPAMNPIVVRHATAGDHLDAGRRPDRRRGLRPVQDACGHPALNTPKIYAHLDSMSARAEQMKGASSASLSRTFSKHEEEAHHEEHKIVVTSPRQRTSPSPSSMSARSTRSATSRSVPWRTGISRRSRSRKARR